MKKQILFFSLMSCFLLAQAQQKMYWTEGSSNKIFQANTDGITNKKEILGGNILNDLVIDTINNKIYLVDIGKRMIAVSDVDSKKMTPVKTGLVGPRGIAYNYSEKMLYFTDVKGIYKMKPDGSQMTTVISNLSLAASLVLDEKNKKMYWGDFTKNNISVANLDGTQAKEILKDQSSPDNLTLDNNGNIYWVNYCGASVCSGISKAKTDGTGEKIIVEEFVNSIGIDIPRNRLFYSKSTSLGYIYTCDLSGGNKKSYFEEFINPTKLVYLNSKNKVYFTNVLFGDVLMSCSFQGWSPDAYLTSDVFNPVSITFDSLNKKMLWINGNSGTSGDESSAIMRANYDGSNAERIIDAQYGYSPKALSIDKTSKKIFWADNNKNKMYSANLDGTGVIEIASDLDIPWGSVVDTKNKKLIWTDWGIRAISRCDFDGKNNEKIIKFSQTLQPLNITIDNQSGKIYYFDGDKDSIMVANVDGKNRKGFLKVDYKSVEALFFDVANQRLYWSTRGISEKIKSCKSDGTDVKDIVSFLANTSIKNLFLSNEKAWNVNTDEANNNGVKLEVFPNPLSDVLNIKTDKLSKGDVFVYNITGALLSKMPIVGGSTSLNTQNIPNGIYLLKITWEDGSVNTAKISK